MDDITNALIGFQVGQWTSQDAYDKAVRKWFDSLPKDARERLIPLNPDVAAAVLRANAADIRADIRADLAPLLQEAHERRRPDRPPPVQFRPRAPLVMLLGIAITFVGMLVQFPGTCLVVVGRRLISWGESQGEE